MPVKMKKKNTIKTCHAYFILNIQKNIIIALLQILQLAPFLYLNTVKKQLRVLKN